MFVEICPVRIMAQSTAVQDQLLSGIGVQNKNKRNDGKA